MVHDIYSIGDAAYLGAVLNAVASIAGTASFTTVVALGLLVGVLLVAFQGLLSGARSLPLQNVFLGFLLYMLIFAPKATVVVHDVYTGEARAVDNVPLGVAFTGSLLSSVGYRLTALFETAFATPAMTERGFATPLHTLQAVRRATMSRVGYAGANEPTPGADVSASMVNYIADCTLAGVDIRRYTLDRVLTTPDPMAAIRFDSPTYTTEYYLGGAPVTSDCASAWAAIDAYLGTTFLPRLLDHLRGRLGLAAGADVIGEVQGALDALGLGAVAAQRYMVATLMVPWLDQGEEQAQRSYRQFQLAQQTAQAAQQRDSQWMSEGPLFQTIVRPMMAFFEAFVYAITPIMAFAIVLGPAGIGLAGKYLVMALWVQLWLPAMAVVNLYVEMSAAGQMDALAREASVRLPSLQGIYHLDLVISHWLAVGGMLASSVPAISLMLVYGSAITATHLLGRIQGGDFVDERIAAPGAVQASAAASVAPLMTHTPVHGAAAPGAEQVFGQFDVARTESRTLASAHSQLVSRAESFMSTLSGVAARSAAVTGESFTSRALRHDFSASQSTTDRFLAQTGERLQRRFADAAMTSDQFAGVLSGAVTTPRGVRLGRVSAELENRFGVIGQQNQEIATAINDEVSRSEGFQAALARAVASDSATGERSVFTDGLSSTETSTLAHAATETVSAAESYQATRSEQESATVRGRFGVLATGKAVASDPELLGRLRTVLDGHNLSGDSERLAATFAHVGNLGSREQAYAMAGMSLLLGYARPAIRPEPADPGAALRERRAFNREGLAILEAAFGIDAPALRPGDAREGEARTAGAPPQGSVRGRAAALDGGAGQLEADSAEVAQRVVEAHDAHATALDDAAAEIREARDAGVARGDSTAVAERDALHDRAAPELERRILERAGRSRPPAQVTLEAIGGAIERIGESAENALGEVGAGAAAFLDAFRGARARGASVGEALGAGITASQEGARSVVAAALERKTEHALALGLTGEQAALYREALATVAPEIRALLGAEPPGLEEAREALLRVQGADLGAAQATLIVRAARSGQDYDLRLIGEYNRVMR